MVNFFHSASRVLAAVLVLACLCQCTTREVKSTRSSFSFAGDGDEDKIRKKFAQSGYTIAEDGSIMADKPDLYSGQSPRGMDGDFQTKRARFRKSKAKTNEFATPEYIQRQEFRGNRETKDSQIFARETNSEARQTGKLFKSRSEGAADYGTYSTGAMRGSSREFETGSQRQLTSAYESAVVAEGVRQAAGYKQNAGLSMNDVKKMLSPGQYARATGIQ